jgi:hypothetical protein
MVKVLMTVIWVAVTWGVTGVCPQGDHLSPDRKKGNSASKPYRQEK